MGDLQSNLSDSYMCPEFVAPPCVPETMVISIPPTTTPQEKPKPVFSNTNTSPNGSDDGCTIQNDAFLSCYENYEYDLDGHASNDFDGVVNCDTIQSATNTFHVCVDTIPCCKAYDEAMGYWVPVFTGEDYDCTTLKVPVCGDVVVTVPTTRVVNVTHYEVKMMVTMAYTLQEFEDKKSDITKGFAIAASVSPSSVTLTATEKISTIRRMLLSSSLDVDVVIQADTQESASDMTGLLTHENVESVMVDQGVTVNLVVGTASVEVFQVEVVEEVETDPPIATTPFPNTDDGSFASTTAVCTKLFIFLSSVVISSIQEIIY